MFLVLITGVSKMKAYFITLLIMISACTTNTGDAVQDDMADDDTMADDGAIIDDGAMTDDDTMADDGAMIDDGAMAQDGAMTDDGAMAQDEMFEGSLFDLSRLGREVQCTILDDEYQATVYVSGEKFLTDATYTQDGETGNYHSISDGEYMYTWTSLEPQGIKMSLEQLKDQAESMEETQQYEEVVSHDEEYSFSCMPWSAQDSMFVPPSDVDFIDFQEQLSQMMDEADLCSSCADLPDAAAQQNCRDALGC